MSKIENLYIMGKRIGLKKADLNYILKSENPYPENIHLSDGPFCHGGWYGTIGIHDF